jgi:hypothetical protein
VHDLGKSIVDELSESHRSSGRLDVRARRCERDYLGRDALTLEHPLAILDVAMSGDGDVVVARVMQTRISFGIDCNPDDAVAAAERVKILRRIEMIVDVDQVVQLARK